MLRKILLAIPLLSLIVFSGCDDENDGSYAKPDLLSADPEIGVIGSEVTITGARLKDVKQVFFADIPAQSFTATDTEIKATVPAGLKDGDILISVFYGGSVEGNLGASDNVPFTVAYAPVILNLDIDEAKPTKSVQVTGQYLKRVTKVMFGSTEGSFIEKDGALTVVVPDMAPGDVQMVLHSPGGTGSKSFTVLAKTPEITSFTESVKTGQTVTVSGLFFEDVQSVKVGDVAVEELNVTSSNELTFKVPQTMVTGKIIITTALGTVESETDLAVVQLIPLPYNVYGEGLNADWEKWDGWDLEIQQLESTEQAKTGTKSIKMKYSGPWGGFQLHPKNPTPFSLEGASKITLSIYGGAGSGGKKVALYIKEVGGGDPPDSEKKEFTLVEGSWTAFEVLLSELGDPANINEFVFQNRGTNPITIYVDDIKIVE